MERTNRTFVLSNIVSFNIHCQLLIDLYKKTNKKINDLQLYRFFVNKTNYLFDKNKQIKVYDRMKVTSIGIFAFQRKELKKHVV